MAKHVQQVKNKSLSSIVGIGVIVGLVATAICFWGWVHGE